MSKTPNPRIRWPLVLVALAGCTPLFGLDGVVNDDPDGDRIPSSRDNCPDIANPDQSDINGDGVGDACQLCMATDPTDSDGDGIPDQCDGCDNRLPDNNHDGVPDACENMAPPHDEDGDGVDDLHDNCPSVANADQADTHESNAPPDGVGDACDDSTGLDRQLFDAFVEPNELWLVVGPGWQLAGDQATLALSSTGVYRYAGTAHGTFRISTHVTLQPAGEAGIGLLDGHTGTSQIRVTCSLRIGGTSALVLAVGTTPAKFSPYSGPPTATIQLSSTYEAVSGTTSFACAVPGSPSLLTGGIMTGAPAWTTGIGGTLFLGGTGSGAMQTAAFDDFDVVTSAP